MKTLSCDRYYSRSSVVFVSHPSRVVVVVVVMHSPTKVPRDSYYYVYGVYSYTPFQKPFRRCPKKKRSSSHFFFFFARRYIKDDTLITKRFQNHTHTHKKRVVIFDERFQHSVVLNPFRKKEEGKKKKKGKKK